MSQFKEGVAKVTSKISTVASNVMETFQVDIIILYVCTCTYAVCWVYMGKEKVVPTSLVYNNMYVVLSGV